MFGAAAPSVSGIFGGGGGGLLRAAASRASAASGHGCASMYDFGVSSTAVTIASAAAAEAAAAALPSEDHSGVHFAIPEGTTTIIGAVFNWGVGDSWKEWGMDKTKVTHVTIPSSVTSIGGGAFDGCSALASLAIPSSVTSIGDRAFRGCSSLASLAIASSVTSIGNHAFQGCSALASLEIPSSVTSIGIGAFLGCSSLASLAIPSSVTRIRDRAFEGCRALASLEIPSSVTSIGDYAFNGCSALASLEIPSSVTSIGNHAFLGCSALASLAIPSAVTSIGVGAFSGCSSLASMIVQPIDVAISTSYEGAAPNTLAIITAFNHVVEFKAVTRIWATDTTIAAFNGRYTEYDTFAAVPRPLRAAPDATTWAGVQRWLWWLPPTSFGAGSDDTRTVCTSRSVTIWNTMASAYRASEVLEVLPDLEPELWELIFTFLRHDQQPAQLCR
eukprot:gene28962-biopygen8780